MLTLLILFSALITLPSRLRSQPHQDGTSLVSDGVRDEGVRGDDDIGGAVMSDFWLFKLTLNLLGYASIFVPGYLVIRWVRQSEYLKKKHTGCLPWVIRLCVEGLKFDPNTDDVEVGGASTTSASSSSSSPHHHHPVPSPQTPVDPTVARWRWIGEMCFCFGGLQFSYLIWGVLQEKIMTRDYISDTGNVSRFSDSQFLVFINRILAFLFALGVVLLTRQPRHTSPLFKYSFASLSNILSSWCQYEALKYVSFPSQVLAKACKIIPVMLMGKVMKKEVYPWSDYFTAALISLGMTLFLWSRQDDTRLQSVTTLSGVILLIGYMTSDSFTANWQSKLFSDHKMSNFQMMCGVNLFSCLLTFVSLLEQGSFASSLTFMLTHFAFVWDSLLLSFCSALGQTFIFRTLKMFGAVTFVIMMTVRQGFAILLSCLIYGHSVNMWGVMGIVLVFIALFLRIYFKKK